MNPATRLISFQQPRTLAFGAGGMHRCAEDLIAQKRKRVLIVSSKPTRGLCEEFRNHLSGIAAEIDDSINQEPTVEHFRASLRTAADFHPDAVIGLGGGSAMDVAKLVAAMLGSPQKIEEVFGIGKLSGRSTYLACLPTTAGTGSEVSPNAILLDEREQLKKGVISPHLMPDAAYVDPQLTLSVPPPVTASTGMDALTHCIEAFANKFAHPVIDHYAIEGIHLISRSLARAVENGNDLDARTNLALGSMYGGICLGPVNTGAVHALAYPLGSEFHVAHGVSNALLLSHVLEFNLPAAPQRYAQIARAMGAPDTHDDIADAQAGLQIIRDLSKQCGIPARLRDFNIPDNAIERMAKAAMTVTRLLERNVREVTLQDAIDIYRRAF